MCDPAVGPYDMVIKLIFNDFSAMRTGIIVLNIFIPYLEHTLGSLN